MVKFRRSDSVSHPAAEAAAAAPQEMAMPAAATDAAVTAPVNTALTLTSLPLPPQAAAHPAAAPAKPLLRGWLHAGTTPVAIALGVILIVFAKGPLATAGAAIYLACSALLFGNSAVYHVFNWSPRVKQVLRRVDHANIFLLIAGTYTPITLSALPLHRAALLLGIVWGVAVLGIFFRVFWLSAPRWLYVSLYIGLGWAAVFFFAEMWQAHETAMILVAVGGLLYTVGAMFYGFKWPLRHNRYFGFHELFHACTVAAFCCHWTAALLAVLDPLYLR